MLLRVSGGSQGHWSFSKSLAVLRVIGRSQGHWRFSGSMAVFRVVASILALFVIQRFQTDVRINRDDYDCMFI